MSTLLDRPLTDIDAAEARLAKQVLPPFGAELEPVQTDPRRWPQEQDDQRGEQTLTLLQLLGYLDEPPSGRSAWRWSEAEIEAGWREWAQDYLAETARSPSARTLAFHGEDLAPPAGPAVTEPDRLRRALKACATLEGEVELQAWPEVGEVSLRSRIALFRLRLFGLHAGTPAAPMPGALAGLLRDRGRWLLEDRRETAVALINRLGAIAPLTRVVADRLAGYGVILRPLTDAERATATPAAPLRARPKGAGRRFVRREPRRARSFRLPDLADPSAREWNTLAVRVLQVRLWTLGYYEGEIDGSWGRLSEAALAEFRADFPSAAGRDDLCDDHAAGARCLDLAAVLRRISAEADEPAERLERAEIDAALNAPEVQADETVWHGLAAANATRPPQARREHAGYVDHHFEITGAENARRKRYYGWRGIFVAFGRFLRAAADRIGTFLQRLRAALAAGLGLVRQVARYVVDASRVAVRVVSLAVQRLRCWLAGTPVITHHGAGLCATRWQTDFDTCLVVSRGCPPETLHLHLRDLDWMNRSFALMIRIVDAVLDVVLAVHNWLLLAWRLLRLVRDVIHLRRDPLLAALFAEQAAT